MPTSISTSTGYLSDFGVVLVRTGAAVSATLLVYDYICTLDQEIELLWSSPFGLASMIFIVNRYLPFFDTFLSINMNFNSNISAEQCAIQTRAVSCRRHKMSFYLKKLEFSYHFVGLMFVGISHSELILMLRTYALWGRKRSILVLLILLTMGFLIPAIVLTKMEVVSEHFVALHGCRITATRNIIFIAFCLLTAYETLLAVLTAVPACQHLPQTRSPWVTKLYKDGIVFYFYLLVLSCTNIVSYRIAPAFGPWLEAPQRVILSVFCSRVLFLIFQGSCSTHGARPRDIETASELPVVTLTEILEMEDFEDM
ncbi:hypothetical protein DFJ43DRAFT_173060 [Lentinula guzmanii]|uniref:DUF6533 domain-containing protein n=1 Tax=Lentinula guzmanii TaxID=2804957 RepID=A0AA38N1E0_9AGAR|nr:hypothetical protein DFJ43DRAFT_173060 [Lentinula guzmanii]